MEAFELGRAYVTLDRFVFFQLQITSRFESRCAQVKKRLDEKGGLGDFESLCRAGAEGDELLWLLTGCEGLSGFRSAQELFGWSATELRKGLDTIARAASVIEKTLSHPFGFLARYAGSLSGLDKTLRSYLALARAAQKDFGHGSQWFLNIAKARLVIHVNHKTNGNVKDKEVSGMIAAMTGTDYNATAQSQWRHKYKDLIRDSSLDPYTTMGPGERAEVRKNWEHIAAEEPEFFKGFAAWATDQQALVLSRAVAKQLNRKKAKKPL